MQRSTQDNYDHIERAKRSVPKRQLRILLTFMVIGQNAWGRGDTLKDATKQWRASGGYGRVPAPDVKRWVVAYPDRGDKTVKPYVDEMGRVMTDKDAAVSEVK